jgi:hypothetical protein
LLIVFFCYLNSSSPSQYARRPLEADRPAEDIAPRLDKTFGYESVGVHTATGSQEPPTGAIVS